MAGSGLRVLLRGTRGDTSRVCFPERPPISDSKEQISSSQLQNTFQITFKAI